MKCENKCRGCAWKTFSDAVSSEWDLNEVAYRSGQSTRTMYIKAARIPTGFGGMPQYPILGPWQSVRDVHNSNYLALSVPLT